MSDYSKSEATEAAATSWLATHSRMTVAVLALSFRDMPVSGDHITRFKRE